MEFTKLIEERRSIRAYKEGVVITKEQIEELMKATVQAPTWKNSETGRYYCAITPEAIGAVYDALPDFNKNSTKNAAYIVVTFVKDKSGFTVGKADNEIGNEWGAYDLGLQNAYMLLKASDMGLDTLIMGLRDADKLRSYFEIPENEELMAVIAIGKKDQEPALRRRKEPEDICVIK